MSKIKLISFFAATVVFSAVFSSFITSQFLSNDKGAYRYSDERLKESIVNISYKAADLEKLRPVSFNWKGKTKEGVKMGFIAQEVKPVFPELITEDSKGMLMVDYGALVPVLVKVINEQELTIEEMTSDIEELKYNVDQLRK